MKKRIRPPALRLYDDEACADIFAGGGGTSTGIEFILGRSPDIAINHDQDALAMHEENHPTTEHLRGDVFHYDPDTVAKGRRFGFAWFSPDCTFHSKAKGGVPFRDKRRSLRVRGLAWVMVHWAESTVAKPRILFMENVEEIIDWGPLLQVAPDQWRPDPGKRGSYWRRLVRRLERAGYVVEVRKLRASEYGAPTSRQRLVMVARCDGRPVVWPAPTHGPNAAHPYRTAAECIDFRLPVPSIFLTPAEAKAWGKAHGVPAPRRPLASATLRRIARGIQRYVLESADPFIVPVLHAGDARVHSVHEPLRTITTSERGEFAIITPFLAGVGGRKSQSPETGVNRPYHTTTAKADTVLVAPTLIQTSYGERKGQQPRTLDLFEPLGTVVAQGIKHSLVAAFLAKHNGGHEATGQQLTRPTDTIVCRENKALVTSNLIKLRGDLEDHPNTAQDVREPMPTLTAGGTHIAEVRAFLVKFFGTGVARSLYQPVGTLTTKDRLGLVTVMVGGEEYALVDIGMRMLTPRELFRAQGFPERYVIDRGQVAGRPRVFTKATQTRLVGNSVPPHLAAAVIGANLAATA